MISSLSYGVFNPSIEMQDRMVENRARRAKKVREELSLAFELVLGYVHPGNLGELPPSPKMLEYKAHQIGLL